MIRGFTVVVAALVSRVAAAQMNSPEFSRDFDRVDRQARQITTQFSCVVDLKGLAESGVATTADTSGAYMMCATLGGRLVGILGKVDSSYKRFLKFAAFDPERRARITTPLDTAEALILLTSQSRAAYAMKDDGTQFLPLVAIRADSGIHVWVVPGSIIPMPVPQVGGEYHFLISADGRKILRADSAAPKRPIPRPPGSSRAWVIETGSDSVPTFSEMLLANFLSKAGHSATLAMKTKTAQLVGDFDMAVWVFMPRKP